MPVATREDDNYFYLDDGSKVAKAGIGDEMQTQIRSQMSSPALKTQPSSPGVISKVQDFSKNLGETMGDTARDALLSPIVVPVRAYKAAKSLPFGPSEIAAGSAAAARDGASWLSRHVLPSDVHADISPSNKSDLREALYPSNVMLTDQARDEMRANATSEQPRQIPELLARPGTPQAQIQQALMGNQGGGSNSSTMRAGGGMPGTSNYLARSYQDMRGVADQESAAAKQAFDVGQKQAAAQAGYEDEKARVLQERQQKQLQLAQKAQNIRDEWGTRIKTAQDELAAVDTRVNPNHFWANKGSGEKVMASIAVFLGGLGGGNNKAMEILDGAVQNDIAAQKYNAEQALARGKAKVEGAQNTYSLYRQMLGDESAALDATYDSALGIVEQRLKATVAGTKNQELQAKLAQSLADIQGKRAEKQADLAGKLDSLSLQRAQLALSAREQAMKEQAASQKGDMGELAIPGVGVALDKDAAKTVREKAASFNSVMNTIGQAKKLRETYGSETLPTEGKAAMKVLGSRLLLQINKAVGAGALDQGSLPIIEQMAGGKLDSFGQVGAGLETLERNLQQSFQEETTPYLQRRTDPVSRLGIQYVER
jgi:hypothetical protein